MQEISYPHQRKVSLKDVASVGTHNICLIFYCFQMILLSSVLLSLMPASFEAHSIFFATCRGRLVLAGRLEGRRAPKTFWAVSKADLGS